MKNILICPRLSKSINGIVFNYDQKWFDFFYNKNVNLIPLGFKKFNEEKILNLNPNGVILPGGNDLYKKKKININFERDNFENKLVNTCINHKIPIIGVCKGFQLITNYFNGKIVKCNRHVRTYHDLKINLKSKFIKFKKLNVNSFHNYGIESINYNFEIISKSKDGLIEIAEHKNKKILCMMFHPERSSRSQLQLKEIIYDFFKIK